MTWACTETTAPTEEPVSLPELKAHSYVTIADDDSLLSAMITAARVYLSQLTSRAFVNATYTWVLTDWPSSGTFVVPVNPLQSVTSIKYYDSNGTQQTVTSTNYRVNTQVEPGRIEPISGYSWPGTDDREYPVEVKFVAGYGSVAESTPMPIRQAIKMLAGHWYQNREGVLTGTISKELEFAVTHLIAPYRMASVR